MFHRRAGLAAIVIVSFAAGCVIQTDPIDLDDDTQVDDDAHSDDDHGGFLEWCDELVLQYSTVSVGEEFVCGLVYSPGIPGLTGRIECHTFSYANDLVVPHGEFRDVSVGGYHLCAVSVDGDLVCAGDNSGSGVLDAPKGKFLQVSAGWSYNCALTDTGRIVCWGWNSMGQLEAPAGTYTSVSAGQAHACALSTSSEVVCWGSNTGGQCDVLPGEYVSVDAGANHTCAMTADRRLVCWGDGSEGQLQVPTEDFISYSAGSLHTCGVMTNGVLRCWGIEPRDCPQPEGSFANVVVGSSWYFLDGGTWVDCAITAAGEVWCWGDRFFREIDVDQ